MNGVHDMGGMDGFGPVEVEPNEPTFRHDWEGRVMAMVRAMGANGGLNIDSQRFARESLPPAVYLASSYYKKWFLAIENQLINRNMLDAGEIAAGHSLRQSPPLKRGKFTLNDIPRISARGSFARAAQAPAIFKPGDKVRAKNINPITHTRLPRYVRGHSGIVERINGEMYTTAFRMAQAPLIDDATPADQVARLRTDEHARRDREAQVEAAQRGKFVPLEL